MAAQTLPIPYRVSLEKPLVPGTTLQVAGKSIEQSQHFSITLLAGASAIGSDTNVVFHLDFRFDEKKVVANSASAGRRVSKDG